MRGVIRVCTSTMRFHVIALISLLTLTACDFVSASSAYDASKSAQLTEEKRREYDILLANELATYNTNTTRCGIDMADLSFSYKCREDFFRQLAADGYEIADIVSRIYYPREGRIKSNRAAYERLHELAEAGDKSALCFAPFVFSQMRDTEAWPYTRETEAVYTKRGMALNLPICALNESGAYWFGVNGYPKDSELSHQRLFAAAKAGLYSAQKYLFLEYSKMDIGNLHTVRKALCWARLGDQHSNVLGFDTYTLLLREAASKSGDPDYKKAPLGLWGLVKKWDPRSTPHSEMPITTKDCTNIEEEN